MQWGLLVISVIFLIVAYIVLQGTRAAMAWRRAAAAGDLKVISDIVEDALSVWRSAKRPKDVAPAVWRGVQGMQAVAIGPDFVRVACQAEGEYRLVAGRWVESSNPLHEGMAITVKAADMLLYELPHFRPEYVQVDVYSAFRDAEGVARRRCILSTTAHRQAARQVDWDEWTPQQIVDALGGRYRLSDSGLPLPIEPDEPPASGGSNGKKAAAVP